MATWVLQGARIKLVDIARCVLLPTSLQWDNWYDIYGRIPNQQCAAACITSRQVALHRLEDAVWWLLVATATICLHRQESLRKLLHTIRI